MQSFLQYREIGRRVQEELERHRLSYVAQGPAPRRGTSVATSRSSFAYDAERAPQLPSNLAGDGVSREDNLSEWHEHYEHVRKWQSQMKTMPTQVPGSRRNSLRYLASQPEVKQLEEEEEKEEGDFEEKESDLEDKVDSDADEWAIHAAAASSRARTTTNRTSTSRRPTEEMEIELADLGLTLTGVDVRDRTTREGRDEDHQQVFVVGYQGDDDPINPHNWSGLKRWSATFLVALVGALVGIAASIDSAALREASIEFGVSEVVESLATGIYLIGFGAGALVAGPFSETFGRNPVYIATLAIFCVFIMAAGLSPNIGSQLAFRFLAGIFGATPLVCAGGSVADMWNPLERVYAFPLFAVAAFMGPVLGPVMGGFIAQSHVLGNWRWTEWVTLIMSGLTLALLVLFQPETYAGVILTWKAKQLRRLTGDDRYAAPLEIIPETLWHRLRRALYRPFVLTAAEPIIMLITMYLTVIYIVLFTFFDGYTYIFADIHGTSEGITGLCFIGIAIGLALAGLLVPLLYSWAKRDLRKIQEQGGHKLPPEFRLWYSMLGGSIAIPVSLFWMGWTSDSNISIWSPLAASVLFGYGILCVFITSYQYIIDVYEIYSASALASATLIRYVAAGGMTVVGIPFYENLGVHYTLTILACLSALMTPVPYIFYIYGAKIRKHSKYAVASD